MSNRILYGFLIIGIVLLFCQSCEENTDSVESLNTKASDTKLIYPIPKGSCDTRRSELLKAWDSDTESDKRLHPKSSDETISEGSEQAGSDTGYPDLLQVWDHDVKCSDLLHPQKCGMECPDLLQQEIPDGKCPDLLSYPDQLYAYPDHPITPQSERFQDVFARKTPSLAAEFRKQCLMLGAPIFMRIFKESKELELWVERGDAFVLFKTYRIAYFSGTIGPKLREGDAQAPEGFYYVSPSLMNPRSRFHLSFNIGYPNLYDQHHQRTGSAIMVHGSTVSIGCFAMTDRVIEEIYTIADHALNAGQPFFRIHIFPFRMTRKNMERYATSPHIGFWNNLREGYEFFEKSHCPPNVAVGQQHYTFGYEQRGS